MKYLKWIHSHLSEIILVALYLFSVTPIFSKPHGMGYYILIGGFLGVISYFTIDKNKKIANFSLHFWLVMGVLVLGATGICFLSEIKPGDHLTILQQSVSCYTGGLLGIIFAGIFETIDFENKKPKNEKEG